MRKNTSHSQRLTSTLPPYRSRNHLYQRIISPSLPTTKTPKKDFIIVSSVIAPLSCIPLAVTEISYLVNCLIPLCWRAVRYRAIRARGPCSGDRLEAAVASSRSADSAVRCPRGSEVHPEFCIVRVALKGRGPAKRVENKLDEGESSDRAKAKERRGKKERVIRLLKGAERGGEGWRGVDAREPRPCMKRVDN